jgi:predicted transcriptional regulator
VPAEATILHADLDAFYASVEQLEGDPETTVEEAMRPGPSTFRPHVPIVEMARYLIEHDLSTVPITTGDGVLVGVLRRDDAARVALEWQREHGEEHDHG